MWVSVCACVRVCVDICTHLCTQIRRCAQNGTHTRVCVLYLFLSHIHALCLTYIFKYIQVSSHHKKADKQSKKIKKELESGGDKKRGGSKVTERDEDIR